MLWVLVVLGGVAVLWYFRYHALPADLVDVVEDSVKKASGPLTISEIDRRLTSISAKHYSVVGCAAHFEALRDLQRDISLRKVKISDPSEGHLLEVLESNIQNQCEILFGERYLWGQFCRILGTSEAWEGSREGNLERIYRNQENLKNARVDTAYVLEAHIREHQCGALHPYGHHS